jgi:membrane protein
MHLPGTLSKPLAAQRATSELKRLVQGVTKQVVDHDVMGLSSEAAYHLLLGFFPFLLFLGALIGLLSPVLDTRALGDAIIGQLEGTAPDDVTSTVERIIDDFIEGRRWDLLALGGVFAAWSGSNAVRTLIKGLNRIQEADEDLGMIPRRLLAFGFLVMFLAVFVAAQVLIQGSSYLAQDSGVLQRALVETAAWIGTLLLVIASVGVFYRLAPAKRRGGAELVTAGGLVFAVVWIGASIGYRLYVSVSGGPQSVFGIIGVVILLMVWFYLTALAVLIGAEVDSYLGKRLGKAKRATEGRS